MKETKDYIISKVQYDEKVSMEDMVAVEYSLAIYINNTYFVNLLCTPSSLKALIVGFLHSEGIITVSSDIADIMIDEDAGKAYIRLNADNIFGYNGDHVISQRTITTACGKGRTVSFPVPVAQDPIKNSMEIDEQRIFDLVRDFSRGSDLFKSTGGVHSCAICTYKEIIYFEEDIGRHNALEKVFGQAFLDNIDLKDKIVLTTGRMTSEIVNKVIRRGVPILVSRSAPSDQAINIAKKENLTLIGFVRGNRMNIYNDGGTRS